MATVFPGFQSALTQLVTDLKAQTEAFNSLKEDLLLQPDPDDEEVTGTHDTSNLLDLNQFLDSRENDQSSKAAPWTTVTRSDSEPAENLFGKLTQALLSTNKNPLTLRGTEKNLTGEFSQDSVKEKGAKYPPQAHYKYLTQTMVNKEIWDLLNRNSRAVDLAFQCVQEPIVQGLS